MSPNIMYGVSPTASSFMASWGPSWVFFPAAPFKCELMKFCRVFSQPVLQPKLGLACHYNSCPNQPSSSKAGMNLMDVETGMDVRDVTL